MRRISAFVLLAMSIAPLAGCTTWGSKLRTGSKVYAPVPANRVEILFAPPVGRKYEQIGICSVLGGAMTQDTEMLSKLRKSAADLGADAVILQGESSAFLAQPVSLGWAASYPKNRGIAIKYLP